MKKLLLFSLLALFTCFAGAQPLSIQLTPSQYSGGYNLSCNGANDGSINLTISGGIVPFAIFWNDSIETEDRDSLSAGQYSVTVVDSLNDTAYAYITLTEPSAISVSLYSPTYTGYNIHCKGGNDGEIVANATGGITPYTYLWNNNSTSNVINSLEAGQYSITVTDTAGCSAIAVKTLIEPSILQSTISSPTNALNYNIACGNASTGTINLSVTGGASTAAHPYLFSWSNGAFSKDIENISAGHYSVQIQDANGCIKVDSITLTDPDELNINVVNYQYNNGNFFSCDSCNDGRTWLGIIGGIPPYTFTGVGLVASYSSIGVGFSVEGISADSNYTVSISDALGCSKSVDLFLPRNPGQNGALPRILVNKSEFAGGFNVSCHNCNNGWISIEGIDGTSPYTFSWVDQINNHEILRDSLIAGQYIAVITDATGKNTYRYITLLEPSYDLSVSIYRPNPSCNGTISDYIYANTLGGTPPYMYFWEKDGDTLANHWSNLYINQSGDYKVLVVDANQDSAIANYTVQPLPPPVLVTVTPIYYPNGQAFSCPTCKDGRLVVSVSGGISPYTFSWAGGYNNDTIVGLTPSLTPYSVVVTDANGCSGNGSYVLANTPPPPMSLTVMGYAYTYALTGNVSCAPCSDGSINLTVSGGNTPYTYNWSNGATTQNLTGIDTGYYSVTVTDMLGATATQGFNIIYNTPPPANNIFLSFMNVDTAAKTVQVWVNNMGGPIGDFGFNLMSGTLQEAFGGIAATNGYTVSGSLSTVFGTRNGGVIPSGSNHLTTLRFSGSLPSSICFMGAGGFKDTLNMPLSVSTGMCVNTGVTPPPPPPPTTNIYLSFMNVDTAMKTVQVWVNNMGGPIGDFGFDLMSGNLQSASGGKADSLGYTFDAFMPAMPYVRSHRNGSSLPSGNYHLTTLQFSGSLPYNSICFMGAGGFKDTLNMNLSVSTGMCITTGVTPPPPPPTSNIYLSFMNVDTAAKTVQVWVNNMGQPIGDFGFNLMSGNLQEAFGGIAAANGYTVNTNSMGMPSITGSRNGGNIPSGNHHLTTLRFNGSLPSYNICFMGAGGFKDTLNMYLPVSTMMCIGTGVTPPPPPPPPPPPTPNIYLSFMNVDTAAKTVQVWVNNMSGPIGDFGFNLMSGNIHSVYGGKADSLGYTYNAFMPGMPSVSGYRNGSHLPSGYYHLATIKFSGSLPTGSICFMGAGGFKDTLNMNLMVNTGMCIPTNIAPPPPPAMNVFLSFMNVDTAAKTVQVWVSNMGVPIGDFGFNLMSGNLLEASGGIAATKGYTVSIGGMGMPSITGSRNGSKIPTGSHHLTTLKFNGSFPYGNICFMGAGGFKDTLNMPLAVSQGMCISTGNTAPPPPPAGGLSATYTVSNFPGGYNVSCSACADGWINLNITGGMSPYFVNWTGGFVGQNRSGLQSGNYHVRITDMHGDSTVLNITLIAPSNQLDVQLTSNINGGCNGGPLNANINAMVLGGTPPYSFYWTGPNGAMTEMWQNIYVYQQGTYSLTAVDANHDTVRKSIDVFPAPSVNLQLDPEEKYGQAHTSCNESDGKLIIRLQGGMPPYNINVNGDRKDDADKRNSPNPATAAVGGYYRYFNTNDTLIILDSLEAGNYWVGVGDMSGCWTGSNVEITQAEPPMASVSATKYENGYYFSCDTCIDAQVTATITGGFGESSYFWFKAPDSLSDIIVVNGASLFVNKLLTNIGDMDGFELVLADTGINSTNIHPETLYLLTAVDELGCKGYAPFILEKPKPIVDVWKLSGNEVDSTSFIGTLNNDDFRIKTNDSLRMVVTNTGEVAIGTDNVPEGYKLAVNGKVITEEVEVRLKSDWPDYVFSKDYNLLTAEELKKYIDEHGHLPNIPSAENVKEKGISLGEMDAMLLRKIEELTLYMLEMQRQNEELKKKIDELSK